MKPTCGRCCGGTRDLAQAVSHRLAAAEPPEFPQRLKAYDDMEFQFLSLYLNGGVAYANTRGYLYRKDRPGQDVAASDTRHFGTFQMLVTIENFLRNRRAPRDHFVMFDLFALDCLSWSYGLIHKRLRSPFRDAARTFLLGGKSFERAANVHWELSRMVRPPPAISRATSVATFQTARHWNIS